MNGTNRSPASGIAGALRLPRAGRKPKPWLLPKRIPGAALDRTRCPDPADVAAAVQSMERELRAGGVL